MNNNIVTYNMPSFTGLTRHDQSEPLFLNDWNLGHNAANKHAVDVQVRSGDYFVTLATVLDELATSSESYAVRSKLEDIVSDLIYLQDTYAITKNNVNVEANRNINQ